MQLQKILFDLEIFLKQYSFWVLLVIGSWAYAIVDFADLNIIPGYGIFYRSETEPLVTFIVGIPLVLTLWQSFRANIETQRQTELGLRPFLRLQWGLYDRPDYVETNGVRHDVIEKEYVIILVNEGSGVAVDVRVEPFQINDGVKEPVTIKAITAMAPNGGVTRLLDGYTQKALAARLDPTRSTTVYQVVIRYKNLEKREYSQTFTTSPGHNDGYEVVEW